MEKFYDAYIKYRHDCRIYCHLRNQCARKVQYLCTSEKVKKSVSMLLEEQSHVLKDMKIQEKILEEAVQKLDAIQFCEYGVILTHFLSDYRNAAPSQNSRLFIGYEKSVATALSNVQGKAFFIGEKEFKLKLKSL